MLFLAEISDKVPTWEFCFTYGIFCMVAVGFLIANRRLGLGIMVLLFSLIYGSMTLSILGDEMGAHDTVATIMGNQYVTMTYSSLLGLPIAGFIAGVVIAEIRARNQEPEIENLE